MFSERSNLREFSTPATQAIANASLESIELSDVARRPVKHDLVQVYDCQLCIVANAGLPMLGDAIFYPTGKMNPLVVAQVIEVPVFRARQWGFHRKPCNCLSAVSTYDPPKVLGIGQAKWFRRIGRSSAPTFLGRCALNWNANEECGVGDRGPAVLADQSLKVPRVAGSHIRFWSAVTLTLVGDIILAPTWRWYMAHRFAKVFLGEELAIVVFVAHSAKALASPVSTTLFVAIGGRLTISRNRPDQASSARRISAAG